MLDTTIKLVESVLTMDKKVKSYNEDNSSVTEGDFHSLKLKHEIAVVDAILAAKGLDEMSLVLALLTAKETITLIVFGAESRAPWHGR